MVFRIHVAAGLMLLLTSLSFAQGPIPLDSSSQTGDPYSGSPIDRIHRPAGGNADGSWLFSSRGSGDSTIFRVNEFDQSLDVIGEVGRNGISDIAFLPDGRLFGSRQVARGTDLMWINPRTGIGEIVGDMFALGVNALVSDSDGVLYAASNTGNFHVIDIDTGLATLVGPLGNNLASVGDLAFDDQGVLFATLAVDPDFSSPVPTILATIDPATGIASEIGATGFDDVFGLAFHPGPVLDIGGTLVRGPVLLGVAGQPATTLELIAIDRQTGVGQSLGTITGSDQMSGLADNLRWAPTQGDVHTVSFVAGDPSNQCNEIADTWTYCQHRIAPDHGPGLDGDDTFAWDANLAANADSGERVFATAAGTVVSQYGEVGPGEDSANTVLIEHCLTPTACDCQKTPTDCWWSRYQHMESVQVTQGQQVGLSTVLGFVSDAGTSADEHLHFAIYEGENARDKGQGLLTSIDAVLIPAPPIFADGFETGDTSRWSLTEPVP